MKKILLTIVLILGLMGNVFSADVWEEGAGNDVISGGDSPSDIDTLLDAGAIEPLDHLLKDYREGCEITYASTSSLTVGDGQIVVENSAGTIRAFLSNSSNTTVTWSDLDTGSEEGSTTYYLYAYCSDPTSDIDFDIVISKNSSTPSGITYYKRLGSFYNDSSSNITYDDITNDNSYFALQLGDWESKSNDTIYQATTDGFVVVKAAESGNSAHIYIYTDSNSTPTTARIYISYTNSLTSGDDISAMCPVIRGDYYKVDADYSPTIYWIPQE